VYAFVSSSPLYENLSTSLTSGTQGANVKALQRALTAAGYYSGDIDGIFDSSTAVALENWQNAVGQSVTGTLDITKFVWVPKGAVISDWQVSLGSAVSSGTSLATVYYPGQLQAQALVGQTDVTSLKKGQSAQLAIDGHDSVTFTGTIASISQLPASSASGGGSSGAVDYTVTFNLKNPPAFARQGMTGTLSIVLARRTNVLLVPTAAVLGSGSSPLVRVLQNGTPVYRSVTTGMATSSLTQITGGLAAGEAVVTGVISSATTTTTSGGGFGGFGGGFGGGTFRRSGGGASAAPSGGQ